MRESAEEGFSSNLHDVDLCVVKIEELHQTLVTPLDVGQAENDREQQQRGAAQRSAHSDSNDITLRARLCKHARINTEATSGISLKKKERKKTSE